MLKTNNFTLEKQDSIATVTFDNGEKAFVFSNAALEELSEALDKLAQEDDVRAVIFTGKGKIFAAGANISNMAKMSPEEGYKMAELGQTVFNKIERSRFLTIAAVNGAAVGGGSEIGLACDFRVASVRAKFAQPEISIGLIPGWGGSRRLERYVGKTKALELILTGRLFSAQEAMEMGLLNKLVAEDQDLLEEARSLAAQVLSKPPKAMQYCKEAFYASYFETDEEAELVERRLFGKCFEEKDAQEGLKAFLEKREPQFSKTF